jgi:hypothetical protein
MMKKILALIVLSIAMVSCYEEYLLDYVYTGIYFPYQQDVRTFVVGEGMKFQVGVTLGGVKDNTRDRNVAFTLDNELITPARLASMKSASQGYIKNATIPVVTLELLPANFYQMTPSTTTMVIKKGWYTGTVVIKADSASFLADSVKTRMSSYVLPFRITSADADTILDSKRINVVGTMYENMLFGNYWHGGSALVKRPGKADTTYKYYTEIPTLENRIWSLKTEGPTTLICNGYSNATTSASATQMKLVLKGTTIHLSTAEDSDFDFTADGPCTYNNARLLQDRRIYLKYKYTDTGNGYEWFCTDTLRFRNRIRDGINEWQDENPGHYE